MTTWPVVTLGEIIGSLEAGVSVNATDVPVVNGADIGVLKVSCVRNGRFVPTENKKVVQAEQTRVAVSPRSGDIIVSRANTFDLVGACGYVREDHGNLFLSDKLWRVVLASPGVDCPRWLIALLGSERLRREFHRRATGTSGSMKNISKEAFLAIPVPRPPGGLQKRLGEVFEQFDVATDALERLLRVKRDFMHGLAQQLLTGRRRFQQFVISHEMQPGHFGVVPKDWRVVPISVIAGEVKARGGDDCAVVYSCTKHEGLVPSLEYFGKQIFSRDVSQYKRLQPGDLAYATNHIEEGSIGLLRDGQRTGLVSPMYTVFRPTDEVVSRFLFALLKTESYRRVFERSTNASVNRRGSLRWRTFSRIQIGLPTVAEQVRISLVIETLEREVEQLAKLVTLLHRQKQALVSGLLSGSLAVPS